MDIETRDELDARILAERASKSTRAVAKALNLTVAEVNAALDRVAADSITLDMRRRALIVELERLEQLHTTFAAKAARGDVQAGGLLVKISERLAALLGLDAAPRLDHPVHNVPGPAMSGTERIQAVLQQLIAGPATRGNGAAVDAALKGADPGATA